MDERTSRQRRNLFIYSGAILILSHGGVSIEAINLPTISIRVTNPSALYALLWLAYGYSVLRYVQHLLAFEKDAIISHYGSCLDKYCRPAIWDVMPEGPYLGGKYGHASVRELHVGRWLSLYQKETLADGHPRNEVSVQIPWRKIAIPAMRGTFDWVFKYPHFTDYLLPLVVAGGVVATCFFSPWKGSLWSIVVG